MRCVIIVLRTNGEIDDPEPGARSLFYQINIMIHKDFTRYLTFTDVMSSLPDLG
jgi:hypothetical protein